jgi:hypothetical protein
VSARTRFAVATGVFYVVLAGTLFAGQVAAWMLTTHTPFWTTVRDVAVGYALAAAAIAAVAYRAAKRRRR